MNSRKPYDLIFSLGEACLCTQALRSRGLQLSSYPLDWLFGSDYMGRCRIIASRFDRFLEKADLAYSYSERSIVCDAYHNAYNDLTFNHDFASGKELSMTYPEVRQKYDRRIARLLAHIEKARRVLLVYIETPVSDHVQVNHEDIQAGYDLIARSFPGKQMDMLYLAHSAACTQTERLGEHVTKITGDYKSKDPEHQDYVADITALAQLLPCEIRLHKSVGYRLRKALIKMCISLIPSKSARNRLKKKCHV